MRKSKSNDKLGIELDEDIETETQRVSVSKICDDSIFAKSELEVGDMVFRDKVTISICKGDVADKHLHRLVHDRHEVEKEKEKKEKASADEVSAEKNSFRSEGQQVDD